MRFRFKSKKWYLIFIPLSVLIYFNSILLIGQLKTDWWQAPPIHAEQINYDDLIKLLKHTNEVVKFFENNYKQINPDGLYGVRIAEGALIQLLWDKPFSSAVELDFKQILESLRRRISQVAEKAYRAARASEPSYASRFDYLISRPYMSGLTKEISLRTVDDFKKSRRRSTNNQTDLDTSYDEPFGDLCYQYLLDDNAKCVVEPRCYEYFANRKAGCAEKSLPHLLAYLIKNNDAKEELKAIIEKDFGTKEDLKYTLAEYYCSRIYDELEITNRTFNEIQKLVFLDVLMEKLLLCTIANVKEFKTDLRWLDMIYAYQNNYGCFGWDENTSKAAVAVSSSEDTIEHLKSRQQTNTEEIKLLVSMLEEEERRRWRRDRHRRVKREDRIMDHGCSSHTTGIALGYYALMIRFNI